MRQQIPDTLVALEITVHDREGRRLFKIVSSKILRVSLCYYACVLMLACVCPHAIVYVLGEQCSEVIQPIRPTGGVVIRGSLSISGTCNRNCQP